MGMAMGAPTAKPSVTLDEPSVAEGEQEATMHPAMMCPLAPALAPSEGKARVKRNRDCVLYAWSHPRTAARPL